MGHAGTRLPLRVATLLQEAPSRLAASSEQGATRMEKPSPSGPRRPVPQTFRSCPLHFRMTRMRQGQRDPDAASASCSSASSAHPAEQGSGFGGTGPTGHAGTGLPIRVATLPGGAAKQLQASRQLEQHERLLEGARIVGALADQPQDREPDRPLGVQLAERVIELLDAGNLGVHHRRDNRLVGPQRHAAAGGDRALADAGHQHALGARRQPQHGGGRCRRWSAAP